MIVKAMLAEARVMYRDTDRWLLMPLPKQTKEEVLKFRAAVLALGQHLKDAAALAGDEKLLDVDQP